MLLSFKGLNRPVALIGCDEMAEHIKALLRGWEMDDISQHDISQQDGDAPDITIRATGGGYSRTSPWLTRPHSFSHPVDAACDFLVDLMRAYVADNEDLLCLHCAAARFDGGLVIFPSTYKAGKSTLSAALAAAGTRLFTDDVLPIHAATGHGMAPGFLPRLRMPLPDNASTDFRAYVAAVAGPDSGRYLYFDPGEGGLAPRGETAPIIGAVLLMRDEDEEAAAGLVPAGADDILQNAIQRNFAHNLSGLDTLERLHGIVDDAACLSLSYQNAEQAAACLRERFGGGK